MLGHQGKVKNIFNSMQSARWGCGERVLTPLVSSLVHRYRVLNLCLFCEHLYSIYWIKNEQCEKIQYMIMYFYDSTYIQLFPWFQPTLCVFKLVNGANGKIYISRVQHAEDSMLRTSYQRFVQVRSCRQGVDQLTSLCSVVCQVYVMVLPNDRTNISAVWLH